MKKRTAALSRALAIGSLVASVASFDANAAVLLSESFTGQTIADGLTIDLITASTADDNLNRWIDFPNSNRWSIQSGGICAAPCSGTFAQHLVQATDNTNLLYYGLSGAGVTAGTTLTLSLDFISSNRAGRAYLVGMTYGQHALDPFAPWFAPGDTNDGVVLASQALSSGSWASTSFSHTLTQAWDVFVVAFEMGGTTGMRGIDNVRLETPPTVPEAGTLALLGLGLAGVGLLYRCRRS